MFKKLFEFLFGSGKKFEIKEEVNPLDSGKKFEIKEEVNPPSEKKFEPSTETWPNKCPRCQTENEIALTFKGKWKCNEKECGHEWQ